ncbi:hypothetical protein EBB07_00870 [Paenibacillaceae bacterium]|nr:hypothetical protein EBB07_00870 [Paenibacillaceae bacterium]
MHKREKDAIKDVLRRYAAGENVEHQALRVIAGRALELIESTEEKLAEIEQEYDELFSQPRIAWKEYPLNQPESHKLYLVSEGVCIRSAQHAASPQGYKWFREGSYKPDDPVNDIAVTHYAEFNLPGQE